MQKENTIGGFVDAVKDFRNDIKRVLAIVEGVSLKETMQEIKRLNKNIEKIDPGLMMTQIKEINDILERIDVATLSKVLDVLRYTDINELQQNFRDIMKFIKYFEEDEKGAKKK